MNVQATSGLLATVLSALGNEGRLRILRCMAERGGEMSSGEIAEQFSTAWSTTTRHLAVLRDAGLVDVTKRGRERIYSLRTARVDEILGLVHAELTSHREGSDMDAPLEHPDVDDLTLDSAMLYVSSIGQSVDFYERLGFRLAGEVEGVAKVAAPGGGHLKLHPAPDVGTIISDGINLYFRVADVDHHYEAATDAGVEFDVPPTTMSWGARHSYVTDPDGHTISFVQSVP